MSAYNSFNAANVSEKFNSLLNRLKSFLLNSSETKLALLEQKLQKDLASYFQRGVLTVAFVGQYSAGKSTLISALTSRRDIYIDADIATDKTSEYDWNWIKLIDTPGLFTDRTDHDAITYQAIKEADLLVFCLTSMLFDSITIENFKKLAYENGYSWKMMLVINKLSAGAGDENQRIENYRKSLQNALKPYNLTDFSLCFIDAKDYCEGIDEEDEFLIEVSRVSNFVDALNQFVDRFGTLAKLDTPIRVVLGCIDDAELIVLRNSTEDTAFFEIMSRLSRVIRTERRKFETKFEAVALELVSAIVNEGSKLAAWVGSSKEDFEKQAKLTEKAVEQYCEDAKSKMEQLAQAGIENVSDAVKDVLQSELAQAFIARLTNISFDNPAVDPEVDLENLRQQIKFLKKIGDKVGVALKDIATNTRVSTTGSFLTSSSVAGSSLHQAVYGLGKLIGFNFRPWQAVNMAKNIANVSQFIGPILGAVAIGYEFWAMDQEKKQDQKLAEARSKITSQFIQISKDLEAQVMKQYHEFAKKAYDDLDQQIARQKEQQELSVATSNKSVQQLVEIRTECHLLLQSLQPN